MLIAIAITPIKIAISRGLSTNCASPSNDDPKHSKLIVTEPGSGYRLEPK